MASHDGISDLEASLAKISLLPEEAASPVWNQVLQNGALNPKCVTTLQPREIGSQENVEDLEEGILDEETFRDAEPTLELREYQRELAEAALAGYNTIICAPTGSGKTRVVTHIIHEHLKQSAGEEVKKVVFLARTVPLAMQQYRSLHKYLVNFKVVNITGRSGNSMRLHLLCPDNDVFVMTPMILVNHLTRKCLADLSVFSMLVFDECHHTKKGEPYNTLMYSYLKMKKSKTATKLPQIVGLSASIGIDKAVSTEEAKKSVLKICANMDVNKISVVERNIEELKQFVPMPDEEMKQLRERQGEGSVNKVNEIMRKLETHIQDNAKGLNLSDVIKNIPKERKSQKYRQWAVKLKREAMSAPVGNEDKNALMCTRALMAISDYLTDYSVALESLDLVELKDVMTYLDKRFERFQTDEKSTKIEHTFYTYFNELKSFVTKGQKEKNPNLSILAKTVMDNLILKGEESRGIIFVKTRALAEALTSWLNSCDIAEVKKLKASVFTSANAAKDLGGMSQMQQEATIESFRSGEVRLLVATSVAEEGLDIPECNLVVKYNHVGNEVSLIQTRGRSRSSGGKSVLLAMESILSKERENLVKVKMMEDAIRSIRAMSQSAFENFVQRDQEVVYKEGQNAEKTEEDWKRSLRREPFRMVCTLCRQVGVESSKIKIINGTCRVSVDRSLLDHIRIISQDQEYFDEIQYVGDVQCMGEPEPGKRCKQILGKLIRHAGNPFVALAVYSFGFKTGSNQKLMPYKQWKKVPYFVSEMDTEDTERYINEREIATSCKGDNDKAAQHEERGESGRKMDVTDDLSQESQEHLKESKREHSASRDSQNKRQKTDTQSDALKEGEKVKNLVGTEVAKTLTEDKTCGGTENEDDDLMRDLEKLDQDMQDMQDHLVVKRS